MSAKKSSARPRRRLVAVVTSDRAFARGLVSLLEAVSVGAALSADAASFASLDPATLSAVVVDPDLDDADEVFAACRAPGVEVPVLAITRRRASQPPWSGAYDQVAAPFDAAQAQAAIARAIERRELGDRIRKLESEVEAARATPARTDRSNPLEEGPILPLREIERRAIARAMQVTGGSASTAARLLGLPRATLYRRLAAEDLLGAERR